MIVFLLVQYTILPLWGSLGAVGLTYEYYRRHHYFDRQEPGGRSEAHS